MILTTAFDVFDPLTGRSPEYFEGEFDDVLYRARKILEGWDSETIRRAVIEVDWPQLVRLAIDDDIEEQLFANLPTSPDDPPVPRPKLSGIQIVFRQLAALELPDLPDASWARLFACAALAYVGEVCLRHDRWEQRDRSKGTPLFEPHDYYKEAGHGVVDAVEAVCMAEFLLDYETKVLTASRSYLKAEGRKNANKRHTHGNQLKRGFIDFYNANKSPTISESIKRYQRTLSENDRTRFKDPVDTYRRALRNWRKAQR